MSILVFCGCAGTHHSASGSADVATLTAYNPIWIVSVDGKPVSRARFSSKKEIAVLPGKHVVELHYAGGERLTAKNPSPYPATVTIRTVSSRNIMVPFVAEPGRRYFIRDKRIDFSWKPYVSETNTPVYLDFPEQQLFAPTSGVHDAKR